MKCLIEKKTNKENFVIILDGSEKSQHPHHHHPHPHHHPPIPTHYSPFYSEMIVQPTTEPVDLAAVAEYDKERQTIEKCLSKLSPPIVKAFNRSLFLIFFVI